MCGSRTRDVLALAEARSAALSAIVPRAWPAPRLGQHGQQWTPVINGPRSTTVETQSGARVQISPARPNRWTPSDLVGGVRWHLPAGRALGAPDTDPEIPAPRCVERQRRPDRRQAPNAVVVPPSSTSTLNMTLPRTRQAARIEPLMAISIGTSGSAIGCVAIATSTMAIVVGIDGRYGRTNQQVSGS
jgi:hypothetical protein